MAVVGWMSFEGQVEDENRNLSPAKPADFRVCCRQAMRS